MSKPLPVPMVLDNHDEWMDAAHKGMDALVGRGRTFTADDLRDIVPVPSNPNWVGTLFQAYKAHGYIRPVGHEVSRSRQRRGGVLRRWEVIREKRS